jgi:hypothetical protein
METTTDYEKQALDVLERCNATFEVKLAGKKPPPFDDESYAKMRAHDGLKDTDQHCRITIRRPGRAGGPVRSWTFDFWRSISDARSGKLPTAYDVLACIAKSEPGTFENFCGDFGYSTDSIKATKIYRAVCRQYKAYCRIFDADQRAWLEEIQ